VKKLWHKFTTWLDLIIARGELDQAMNACRDCGGYEGPYGESLDRAMGFYDEAKWNYDEARKD